MDYFDLPLTGGAPPSTSRSTSRELPEHQSSHQAQHAMISLEDVQDDDPTPVGTPLDHPNAISISTAFFPTFSIDDRMPDIVLVASDRVHFYIHRQLILVASTNQLGNLIPSDSTPTTVVISQPLLTIHIPHPSAVLNVMLHTIYNLSCLHFLPTLEVVDAALDALVLSYGVCVQTYAAEPHLPLHQLILSFAPFRPLDAYALAAHHMLEGLAVTISSHLLAYDLARLPDSAAVKMGPLYLKRLFMLHQSRLSALRNILFKPPAAHPLVQECSPEIQRGLMRAWALAVAQLVWDVLPSTSTSALQSQLEPVGATVACQRCIIMLQRRIQEVIFEWSAVKRTI